MYVCMYVYEYVCVLICAGEEGAVNTEVDRDREIIRQRLLDKRVWKMNGVTAFCVC